VNGQIQYEHDFDVTSDPTPETVSAATSQMAADLTRQIARDGLPIAAARRPLPPEEECHFAAPVRFGRRHADAFGYLELTNLRIRFHGSLDLGIVWNEVAGVELVGHDLIVSLSGTRRRLRFSCQALGEAIAASVIARHLITRVLTSSPGAQLVAHACRTTSFKSRSPACGAATSTRLLWCGVLTRNGT